MAGVLVAGLLALSACSATTGEGAGEGDGMGMRLPGPTAGFDYQLGGAYDPPAGVTTVARDRTAPPAGVGYDICYVNGFQTQPGESEDVARRHPELLVRMEGAPLADPGWPDEYLFDTSTPETRAALAAMVGPWIEGCRDAGYDAVEIDNLDSFSRSEGRLTAEDNLALAAEYVRLAHGLGLAIAQKNAAELVDRGRAAGFDFAVTESCAEFAECDVYADAYPVVLDIEYDEDGFDAACAARLAGVATILRDPLLAPPSDPAYRYAACEP
jgi:hypothetical protein